MAPGEERRREPRYGARLDVRFARQVDAARALNAYSINFSAGGLCLRTKGARTVGERLELDVTIEGQRFQLEAEVAWIRGDVCGLRFVNVAPGERTRLEAVARLLERKQLAVETAPPDGAT